MKSIQTEFFDEENRYKKLTELGDPPEELNSVMEEKIDLLRDKCALLRKRTVIRGFLGTNRVCFSFFKRQINFMYLS